MAEKSFLLKGYISNSDRVRIDNHDVAAKYLMYNGKFVLAPDGSKYKVPIGYTIDSAGKFADTLDSIYSLVELEGIFSLVELEGISWLLKLGPLADAVKQGGAHDLQRWIDPQTGKEFFVPDFTYAASFHFGLLGQRLGIPLWVLTAGGGFYNIRNNVNQRLEDLDHSRQHLFQNPDFRKFDIPAFISKLKTEQEELNRKDKLLPQLGWNWGNNPRNVPNIEFGFRWGELHPRTAVHSSSPDHGATRPTPKPPRDIPAPPRSRTSRLHKTAPASQDIIDAEDIRMLLQIHGELAPDRDEDPSSESEESSGGGQPAARMFDMHVCPLTTATVPHEGGPVTEGSTNVLISGERAARVSDALACVGATDAIATGSTTVYINGRPAARVTDRTAHGGELKTGASTVHFG